MSAEAARKYSAAQHPNERLVKVETQYDFVCKRLDSIDTTLQDLTKTVQSMRDYLNEHKGGLTAKTKMWFIVYSFVTIISALGLHTFAYKLFGWNI